MDLAMVIEDMAHSQGWAAVARQDFDVVARRNYASINPRSQPYWETTPATESVLVMEGASC